MDKETLKLGNLFYRLNALMIFLTLLFLNVPSFILLEKIRNLDLAFRMSSFSGISIDTLYLILIAGPAIFSLMVWIAFVFIYQRTITLTHKIISGFYTIVLVLGSIKIGVTGLGLFYLAPLILLMLWSILSVIFILRQKHNKISIGLGYSIFAIYIIPYVYGSIKIGQLRGDYYPQFIPLFIVLLIRFVVIPLVIKTQRHFEVISQTNPKLLRFAGIVLIILAISVPMILLSLSGFSTINKIAPKSAEIVGFLCSLGFIVMVAQLYYFVSLWDNTHTKNTAILGIILFLLLGPSQIIASIFLFPLSPLIAVTFVLFAILNLWTALNLLLCKFKNLNKMGFSGLILFVILLAVQTYIGYKTALFNLGVPIIIPIGVLGVYLINKDGSSRLKRILGYLIIIIASAIPALLVIPYDRSTTGIGSVYYVTVLVAVLSWWGFSLYLNKD
jgi:hypothetical protein